MPQQENDPRVHPVSTMIRGLFLPIAKHNLKKGFRTVRVANVSRLRKDDAPLVMPFNHASWWDPLACLLLTTSLLPKRSHYAPMESVALNRFRFFRKLGVFPVELDSIAGARNFLADAQQILLDRKNVLWLSPQGRFVDVRERPLKFAQGIGALLARKRELTLQPVAIEYPFWNQRLPELLINIGEPVFITPSDKHTTREWTTIAENAMARTQDELQALALTRDPRHFRILLDGAAGTGGFYGFFQRLRNRHLPADHLTHEEARQQQERAQ